MERRLVNLWRSLSTVGLVLGTLFYAASLTPSLLPRSFLLQGALSGCCFAIGYGLGVFGRWLWIYMELPKPREDMLRIAKLAAAAICALIAVAFLWRAAEWQNSIRALMQLEPVETAHPFKVGLIALATFTFLILLARLFRLIVHFVSTRLRRVLPRRVANVLGVLATGVLFWSVLSGVVFRAALHVADSSLQQLDELIEPETSQPSDPLKTGSDASLVKWEELGRMGRSFVTSGPTREALREFSGKDALEPIRVYVGLRSAETAEQRAKLALEELKRVGGLERSALVIVTPTGTGWIDPAAMDGMEYLFGGDVASIGQQYSYLQSWLALLVEPEYGAGSARALFSEIYGHWTKLPRESRPKLYLHGLSLGSKNSSQSTDLFEVFADPFQGALWSGPPFSTPRWRSLTADRNADSPAWLPRFRDGSLVRFMNQDGFSAGSQPASPWGPIRIVYLQYASDPITFFGFHDLFRQPDWLEPPRGPDVSPQLQWYPIVTFLQLALDTAISTTTPVGYGHVFAPAHYIDAWIEVTGVQGWRPEDINRLKQHLSKQQRDENAE